MGDLLIGDEEFSEDLKARIQREIEDIEKSGIPDMELMSHYQYLYNIAWMKLYNIMEKRLEEKVMKEYKNKINGKQEQK